MEYVMIYLQHTWKIFGHEETVSSMKEKRCVGANGKSCTILQIVNHRPVSRTGIQPNLGSKLELRRQYSYVSFKARDDLVLSR